MGIRPILRCQKCRLAATRVKVVLGRGDTQAPILIVGEAPGKTEDVLGQAFIGESGQLFNDILKRSGISVEACYFTNTVLCRPCDNRSDDNREPLPEEILACLPNVQKVIEQLKKVEGIIFAGKISKKWYGGILPGLPRCTIIHPAALLRQGGKASSHYRDALNALKEFKNVLNRS